ncbi:MAG TPA: hypothetical protein VGN16_24220 [Acidobacteriaceae bacterium]|jgi:hypothetical protein
MGITVVLFLYATVFLVLATVCAAVLWLSVLWLVRKGTPGRKRAQSAGLLLPFLSVAFLGVWFIGYWVMNDTFFHRDPGLGDSWYTPMPNGYMMDMIDVTNRGIVYNPKSQGYSGSVHSASDAVFDVVRLQVDGNWIAGTICSDVIQHMQQDLLPEDKYFLLNIAAGKTETFTDLQSLKAALATHGLALHLRTFWEVFCDYRNTWFDYAAGILALLVPCTAFVCFVLYVIKLRRRARLLTEMTA